MSNFFDSELSSPGQNSTDPVMAAINGELSDGDRSPLNFSTESYDISDKIVPMSGPDALELDKPIGEDEFVRQARRVGTDPLTGSDEPAIQTRSGSDLAGNNRSETYDLGTLNGNHYYNYRIAWSGDLKDFYKFSVGSRARVEIDLSLSGLSDNADLYLHNSRGKAIKKSRRGGTASESISRTLNPGDYYIRVKSKSRSDWIDYDLEFSFSELPPDSAGNNRRKARSLGYLRYTGPYTGPYNDFVGRGDRVDFYTFTLDGERDADISLDGLSGNADLHLWKKGTRKAVGRSTNSGSSSESINQSLGAGTYYLRVKSKGKADTDYSLSLKAVEPGTITSPSGNIDDTWQNPLPNHFVTSPFGWRQDPFLNIQDFHNGIDLATPKGIGSRVLAAKAGTVSFAGWFNEDKPTEYLGKYVEIDHGDGFVTQYGHLDSWLVSEGDVVSAGERIGRMGNTGRSTGPHLHFVIEENGVEKNPSDYVDF